MRNLETAKLDPSTIFFIMVWIPEYGYKVRGQNCLSIITLLFGKADPGCFFRSMPGLNEADMYYFLFSELMHVKRQTKSI